MQLLMMIINLRYVHDNKVINEVIMKTRRSLFILSSRIRGVRKECKYMYIAITENVLMYFIFLRNSWMIMKPAERKKG